MIYVNTISHLDHFLGVDLAIGSPHAGQQKYLLTIPTKITIATPKTEKRLQASTSNLVPADAQIKRTRQMNDKGMMMNIFNNLSRRRKMLNNVIFDDLPVRLPLHKNAAPAIFVPTSFMVNSVTCRASCDKHFRPYEGPAIRTDKIYSCFQCCFHYRRGRQTPPS
jgi:hypothetical protein